MHDGDTQKRLDIDVVWLWLEWIQKNTTKSTRPSTIAAPTC